MRVGRRHHRAVGNEPATWTHGRMRHKRWQFDLTTWFCDTFVFRGLLGEVRRRTVHLARLQPGEHVLDVGCGTGTLALASQRLVGSTGRVVGNDAEAQQIARARAKAARRQVPIAFEIGVLESLPLPDHSVDVVLSTMMLHHVSARGRQQGLAEIARVLKPGGRLVLADFTSAAERQGGAARFHAGGTSLHDLEALITEAGFQQLLTEELRRPRHSAFPGAGIVAARTPLGDGPIAAQRRSAS